MSVATTLRFDETDKVEATDLLKSMGVTFNGYLGMAVKQLINQRRIPFEIVPAAYEPTEETRLAMLRAEAKAAGLIPDDDLSFADPDDFIASLEE
ncbi:MAG: type II toxin-antitoxin system RelB/DinJ family antitoxin [Eggerthellaceae bacterium]|nr:type II toxin-antitoxin system RelB/DinJ family antitoxin [Eggerthellaceae bacterium]